MTDEEWALLDRKALAQIRLCLTKRVAFNISKESTTSGLMSALANYYEKQSTSNRLYLLKSLITLKMSDDCSVANHLNEFNTIWAQLESLDVTFTDDVRALMFLCSLPDSWNNIVLTISNASKKALKFDDVVSTVLNDELMRKSLGYDSGTSSSNALSVDNGKRKERGRSRTKWSSKERGRSKSKGKFKNKIVCWNCQNEGHVKKDCPNRGKDGANVVNPSEEYDELCLSAYTDLKSESWFVDSGASFHCTAHREWFANYVQGDFGHVTVGNGQECKIVGKGTIQLKLQNGGKLFLQEVRHIPELKKNLISVSKLDSEGYKVSFEENQWKINKGAMVVMKGERVGTLYLLSSQVDHIVSLAAEKNEKATLWHHRLGHLSESGMRILQSKDVLTGMKDASFDFCENCIFGKQKRVSFMKDGKEKKSERLELVYTDVWGPSPVKSFGGNSYFVTFIDDSSRKTWIYTLKQKSDVFEIFKVWKALVENETGLKLKCLLSDNGGEYCNKEFDNYCSTNGIRRLKTVPRTPQQNGVAERMNRTIMERARSMRLHAGVPLQLWGAAVETTIFLINRSPSSALDGGIPEEVWSEKLVNYSFLKVFGCIAYAHVDQEMRRKLDSKSQKCVFIGYGGDEYGYRL